MGGLGRHKGVRAHSPLGVPVAPVGPARCTAPRRRVRLKVWRHALHFAAVSGTESPLRYASVEPTAGSCNASVYVARGSSPARSTGSRTRRSSWRAGAADRAPAPGLNGIVDLRHRGSEDAAPRGTEGIQQHPIRGTIMHVDFHEARLEQPIHAHHPRAPRGRGAGVETRRRRPAGRTGAQCRGLSEQYDELKACR